MPNAQQLGLLRQFQTQEFLRRTEENEKAMGALREGKIPTSPETRRIINMRVGSERQRIISQHAYWTEKKLREGLEALVDTAHTAFVDICRHEAALTAFSSNPSRLNDHVQYTVSNPFQKDVMAFCGAAFGIIDTVRRFAKRRPDLSQEIKILIDELFNDDLSSFIQDLRKNLSHGSVVIPGWRVTKKQSELSGAMVFSSDELLLFGAWSTESKRYIANGFDQQIDVRNAVKDYDEKIQKFYGRLSDLFARNVTISEKDYYDIDDEYRRTNSRQFVKILASQVGINRNPYDYLHRFFRPDQVREILRRPNCSKEQVDFMISLKSVETDCDDDLRQSLYNIFKVRLDDTNE